MFLLPALTSLDLEGTNEGDYLSQALNVKMNVEEHNQCDGNHDEEDPGEVSLTKKIEVVKLALEVDKNWYWCHILQNCVHCGVRTTTLKKSPLWISGQQLLSWYMHQIQEFLEIQHSWTYFTMNANTNRHENILLLHQSPYSSLSRYYFSTRSPNIDA
uniref:Uncharacterized protein n=1 Tax=Candidozyma auris TaxID=498019 RepID=A0A0L0NZZ0_CANAR